jgi:hypothetical protein
MVFWKFERKFFWNAGRKSFVIPSALLECSMVAFQNSEWFFRNAECNSFGMLKENSEKSYGMSEEILSAFRLILWNAERNSFSFPNDLMECRKKFF